MMLHLPYQGPSSLWWHIHDIRQEFMRRDATHILDGEVLKFGAIPDVAKEIPREGIP